MGGWLNPARHKKPTAEFLIAQSIGHILWKVRFISLSLMVVTHIWSRQVFVYPNNSSNKANGSILQGICALPRSTHAFPRARIMWPMSLFDFRMIPLTLFFLLILIRTTVAYCPPGCTCSEQTLNVVCDSVKTDTIPIFLNPSLKHLVWRTAKFVWIEIQFDSMEI
jgi:hypothetical protein